MCLGTACENRWSEAVRLLEKIIVVDDEPAIGELTALALSTAPAIQVEVFQSGRQALQRIVSWQPDLLLVDIHMPDLDGLELLRALRQQFNQNAIPAILFTSDIRPQNNQALNALGIIAVLHKPFDPESLAQRLQALWRYYHGERANVSGMIPNAYCSSHHETIR